MELKIRQHQNAHVRIINKSTSTKFRFRSPIWRGKEEGEKNMRPEQSQKIRKHDKKSLFRSCDGMQWG